MVRRSDPRFVAVLEATVHQALQKCRCVPRACDAIRYLSAGLGVGTGLSRNIHVT
jgi:hypothetical protein